MKRNFYTRSIAIVLMISLFISIIPFQITASADDSSSKYPDFQMKINLMELTEDGLYEETGSEYTDILIDNEFILIDLEWICEKLGLVYTQMVNGSGDAAYKVRKPETCLEFNFKANEKTAIASSPYMGEIIANLGTEIIAYNGKVWIPFVMFLNLFDSQIQIMDGEIYLYPYLNTVVDILHYKTDNDYILPIESSKMRYQYDIVNDSHLGEANATNQLAYIQFYRKVKGLFQGAVQLDMDKIKKALPNNTEDVAESLAIQLFTSSEDELNSLNGTILAAVDTLNGSSGLLDAAVIDKIKEGSEESFKQACENWIKLGDEMLEQGQYKQNTGFISVDQIEAFHEAAASDLADEYSIMNNIKSNCQKYDIYSKASGLAFNAFVKYVSLSSEIAASQQKNIDSMKQYLDYYNKFDSLDAFAYAVYAGIMQQDAYTCLYQLLRQYDSDHPITEEGLETYRNLEWVRMKSYYLIRQNMLAYYKPMEKDHDMSIITSDEIADSKELLQIMSVLNSGTIGVTQAGLDSCVSKSADINKMILSSHGIYRLIKGKVTDEEGKPVSAVIIANAEEDSGLNSNFVSGDSDGIFSILLCPGKYNLSVEVDGYQYDTYSVEIEVPDWNITEYEIPTIILENITREFVYEKYKELIEKYEKTYGTFSMDTKDMGGNYVSSWMTGLCYLELIDFDNNGKEELLVIYKKTKQKSSEVDFVGADFVFEVWEYKQKNIHLIDSGELYGNDGNGQTLVITQHQDNTYVLTGSFDSFDYQYYHGYNNSRKFNVVREALMDLDDNRNTYKIDGINVSEEEWEKEEKEWSKNKRSYPMNSSAGLDKMSYYEILNIIVKTKEKLGMNISDMDTNQKLKASVINNGQSVLLSVSKGIYYWEKTITYGQAELEGTLTCADLTGDNEDELILEIGFIGSTYAAANVYVFTCSNNKLEQILYLEDGEMTFYKENYYFCRGVSRIQNGNLYIIITDDIEDEEVCFTYKNKKWIWKIV